MKKIIYLAICAIGLQACLKDKDRETDIFNGVGGNPNVIAFGSPNRLSAVNVLDTKVSLLPKFVLEDENTAQEYEIEVELLSKELNKDLVVNLNSDVPKIAEYNAKRVAEYNALKAEYDADKVKYDADLAAYNAAGGASQVLIPEPKAPVEIPLYVSFEPLPAGKYTVPNTVTILKGTKSAIVKLIVPDASRSTDDYKQLARYMLPITLQTDADILIANPTLLLSVISKLPNPYTGGIFKYTGTLQREGVPTVDIIDEDNEVENLNLTTWLAPVGFFAPTVNMTMSFSGSNVTISAPPIPNTLSTQPAPPANVIFQFPALEVGNSPTIEFAPNGEISAIRGLKYTYKNSSQPAGFLRSFEIDMVRQ